MFVFIFMLAIDFQHNFSITFLLVAFDFYKKTEQSLKSRNTRNPFVFFSASEFYLHYFSRLIKSFLID